MDLLWLKKNNVEVAFEVEATTTMTSALLRGSNLPGKHHQDNGNPRGARK